MAKRRRKIIRTPPPWKSAIGVAMLAHVAVISLIIALGWRPFTTEKPGSTIFVNDVVIGDPEGGEGFDSAKGRDLVPPQPLKPLAQPNFPSAGSPPHRLAQSLPRLQDDRKAGFENGTDNGTVNSLHLTGSGTGIGNGSGTGGAGNPVLTEIRRRIEQSKRYPSQAREQHVEGKVGVQFRIQSNGQVQNVRITHSSGTPILDDAAVQAVQHSAPLPYYENTIDLSLAFRLR